MRRLILVFTLVLPILSFGKGITPVYDTSTLPRVDSSFRKVCLEGKVYYQAEGMMFPKSDLRGMPVLCSKSGIPKCVNFSCSESKWTHVLEYNK